MSLGTNLRMAREKKGLTVAQVAEQTRMIHQMVEEFENDDFHRIAAPIYGRGFIKLYAECVDLEPEPLLKEFSEVYSGLRRPVISARKVRTPEASVEDEPPKIAGTNKLRTQERTQETLTADEPPKTEGVPHRRVIAPEPMRSSSAQEARLSSVAAPVAQADVVATDEDLSASKIPYFRTHEAAPLIAPQSVEPEMEFGSSDPRFGELFETRQPHVKADVPCGRDSTDATEKTPRYATFQPETVVHHAPSWDDAGATGLRPLLIKLKSILSSRPLLFKGVAATLAICLLVSMVSLLWPSGDDATPSADIADRANERENVVAEKPAEYKNFILPPPDSYVR